MAEILTSASLPLFAVAVGIFGISMFVARRSPRALLLGILMLLIGHQYLMRLAENLLGVSSSGLLAISLWKEMAMAALVIVLAWRFWKGGGDEIDFIFVSTDVLLLVWAGLGLIGCAFSQNKIAAVAALRDYFQPIVFYLAARGIFFSREGLQRTLVGWQVLGTLIAILAIWQGLTWKPEDFVAWGYGRVSGQVGIPYRQVLGRWIIRPPVTFTGPNELAVHMVLLSLFAALMLPREAWLSRIRNASSALVQWGALMVTTSRSGIAGMLASLGVLGSRELLRRAKRRHWWRIWWLLPLSGVALIVLALVAIPLPSIDAIIGAAFRRLREDYHIRDTVGAIQYLSHHPAGAGMGLVGPRQGFGFPTVFAFHVEGSLFQLASDMGVWGLASFLLFLGSSLRVAWMNWNRVEPVLLKAVTGTAFAGWVGALVAFTFLPLMQALPLMAWLWFLLGLAVSAGKLERQWETAAESAGTPAPAGNEP